MSVSPGSPLTIRAKDWNRVLATAEHTDLATARATPILAPLVRNLADEPVPRYGVLGLCSDAAVASGQTDRIALSGIKPDKEFGGVLAIAQEPIKPNRLGRCCVSGVTFARVSGTNLTDCTHAIPDGSVSVLRAATHGPVRLLSQHQNDLWLVAIGWRTDQFYGVITNALPSGPNRWLYEFQEVVPTGQFVHAVPPSPITGTAINLLEWNNLLGDAFGNGQPRFECAVWGCGQSVQTVTCLWPIGIGALVHITGSFEAPLWHNRLYLFSASNAVRQHPILPFRLAQNLVKGGTAEAMVLGFNPSTGTFDCPMYTIYVTDVLGCFSGLVGTRGYCSQLQGSTLYHILTLCC